MIRTLLEWLESRSIDEGKPLPRPLAWLADRWPGVRQFREDAERLDVLLSEQATARRRDLGQAVSSSDAVASNPRGWGWWLPVSGAAAAAVFGLIVWSGWHATQPAPPPEPQGFVLEAPDFSRWARQAEAVSARWRDQLTEAVTLPAQVSAPNAEVAYQLAYELEAPMRREWDLLWQDLRGIVERMRRDWPLTSPPGSAPADANAT